MAMGTVCISQTSYVKVLIVTATILITTASFWGKTFEYSDWKTVLRAEYEYTPPQESSNKAPNATVTNNTSAVTHQGERIPSMATWKNISSRKHAVPKNASQQQLTEPPWADEPVLERLSDEAYESRLQHLESCQNGSTLIRDPRPYYRPNHCVSVTYNNNNDNDNRDAARKKACYLSYCNAHTDLMDAFCEGNTCESDGEYGACEQHWRQHGVTELARAANPDNCVCNSTPTRNTPPELKGTVPYVFVVPSLDTCPDWFKANLVNTMQIQSTGRGKIPRNGPIQPVVLIESAPGACKRFCQSIGSVHVEFDPTVVQRYLELVPEDYPAENAAIFKTIFPRAVARHFMLNEWLQQAEGIDDIVYLDWDTVVYIDSGTAAGMLRDANVQFATCFDPALSTVNNVYVYYTRESLEDLVKFMAIQMLVSLPDTSCPNRWRGNDMQLIGQYYLHQFKNLLDEDVLYQDTSNVLRNAERLQAQEAEQHGCTNRNVNCSLRNTTVWPWSFGYGSHQPAWHFDTPKFDAFNLCEPFGEGNLVSEYLYDGPRRFGSTDGGAPTKTPNYYEHVKATHPTIDCNKLVTFLGPECEPFLSQIRPHPTTPMWGWKHYAPESPSFGVHLFRVWAVHMAGDAKEWIPLLTKRAMQHRHKTTGMCYPGDSVAKWNGRDLKPPLSPKNFVRPRSGQTHRDCQLHGDYGG